MSNPDNTTDKDFVMSDSDTNEDVSDRYENKTAKTVNALYRKTSSMPLIIGAVGFLILIILLITVISRSQDLAEKKQLLAIEERLDVLAEKINRLETTVTSKMDRVIMDLEIDKQMKVEQKSLPEQTPPPAKKEQKDEKPKVHTVKAGETLFRISQRYGLSIEQLRTYNKLDSNAKIYPRQELKLTP